MLEERCEFEICPVLLFISASASTFVSEACTYCPVCLDLSAPGELCGSLPTSFRSLSKCHLFLEALSWTIISKRAPTSATLHSLTLFFQVNFIRHMNCFLVYYAFPSIRL